LAKRPGQNKTRVTAATLAHRLGTLRMFFVRIDEWGWGGRGDVLRGSHGDVAGAESGASSVERSTSEHGNHPWSARGHVASVIGRAGHTVGRTARGGAEPS
jgi:hypothetical protein